MNYESFFRGQLDGLRREGRYRVFADLERQAGDFPRATHYRNGHRAQVTVWCSNDYLGMGQHPAVLAAMHEALDRCGAGAGGTRNISGTNHYHVLLERELADLHGKEAALLFTSGYVSNWASLGTLAARMPGLRRALRRRQPRLDDRGHPPQPRRAQRLRATTTRTTSTASCAELDPGAPKLVAFESRLFDGRRHRADRRALRRRRRARRHDLSRRGPRRRPLRPARRRHRRARGPDAPADGDRGHARQGVRRDGRLHRRLGRACATSCAASPRASSSPPRCRRRVAAGACASIRHLKASSAERERQQERVATVRRRLDAVGIPHLRNASHIVPVMVGDPVPLQADQRHAARAATASTSQPINYPTVPRGTERLRITPSPVHTDADIDHLVGALAACWAELDLKQAA